LTGLCGLGAGGSTSAQFLAESSESNSSLHRWKSAMKSLLHTGLAWLATGLALAAAQQPTAPLETPAEQAPFVPPSLSTPPVTPELWVYSQELRRHDDPAQAVRRKAELAADQRQARLAALRWYGFSNSRPVASATPFMGQYSPAWVGNGWERFDWVAGGGPSVSVYVDSITPLR
jgi:hypothetical protein